MPQISYIWGLNKKYNMKSNKITHTIAFFIIGLFTFVSSQAQEAKTLLSTFRIHFVPCLRR